MLMNAIKAIKAYRRAEKLKRRFPKNTKFMIARNHDYEGELLQKGTPVRVVAYDGDKNTVLVRLVNETGNDILDNLLYIIVKPDDLSVMTG